MVTAVDHKPKRTTELQRLVNLRHEPRCAVLFDHTDSDWARLWWVRADGVATVTDDPTPGHPGVAALVDRYEIYADRQPAGPLVVVEVNTWSGWAADATVSPVGR